MNYTHRITRVKEDVDWLESEIKRLHTRLDEYATLVEKISKLVEDSNSRLAGDVYELIEEHYVL